jgi:multidrug efflux system membrane fusion protein
MISKNAKRLILILSLIAAGLSLGCGSDEHAQGPAGPVVGGVTTETVRLQPMPDLYEAVGTVRSATTSVLGAQISGTVRQILVQAGDHVRRGQLLAVLDDRTPRAQLGVARAGVEEAAQGLAEIEQALEAARAEQAFAEATFRRYQGLLDKNSLSRQEYEGAEARSKAAAANVRALESKKKGTEARQEQAQAQHDSAETVYSYSHVISPINGIVTAKSVDAGTLVMPGTPLFTVEDTSRYRLEASLPEQFLSKAKVGEEVAVQLEERKMQGRVGEIVPAADVASRTFLVKIDLPGDCACRSGQYGKALFPVGEQKRLVVPRRALVEYGALEGVYTVNAEGGVEYRLVKTGKSFGENVEILSGLAEGDRVATLQLGRLRDGARAEGE